MEAQPVVKAQASNQDREFLFAFRLDDDGASNEFLERPEDDDFLRSRQRRVSSRSTRSNFSAGCVSDMISSRKPSLHRSQSPTVSRDGDASTSYADTAFRLGSSASSLSQKGLITTAINGVFKLMQDHRAQKYLTLHRHCISVLKDDPIESASDARSIDPIVDLRLLNPSKHHTVPSGFEIVRGFEMKLGKASYCLYQKRISACQGSGESTDVRPITDVQVILPAAGECVPLGYVPLLQTVFGDIVSLPVETTPPPMLLCYNRFGQGRLHHLAVIRPSKGEPVPMDHVMIQLTPWKRGASWNPEDDGFDQFLCVSKDPSRHIIQPENLVNRPDLKYLTPFLLACHTKDCSVALTALSYLETLISGGFCDDVAQPGVHSYVSTLAGSLCDAALSVPSRDFYMKFLKCLSLLVGTCGMNLRVDDFYNIALAGFQAQDRRSRLILIETMIDVCLKSYAKRPPPNLYCEDNASASIGLGIVTDCCRQVVRGKTISHLREKFCAFHETDPELRQSIDDISSILFEDKTGRVISTVVLLLCKIAHSSSRSENVMCFESRPLFRRDALLALRKMLRKCVEFNCIDEPLSFLVRQFVCPVVLEAFLYGVDDVFRISLDLIKFMWKNWLPRLQVELGAIVEIAVLSVLSNNMVEVSKRQSILEMLLEMVEGPDVVVNMFYNFDNIRGWSVFERIVSTLCKFAEKARGWDRSSAERTPQLGLERHAVDVLVKILKSMHDWYFERQSSFSTLHHEVGTVASFGETETRRGTVLMRFTKQKEMKKMQEKAMRMACESGIKHAVKYMVAIGLLENSADSIASFLHETIDVLDSSDLGEYIAGTRSARERPFEEEIRLAYIRRFEYPSDDLIAAMRQLLTEQGFKLPSETQQIERILNSFSQIYYERNPVRFRDPDAAIILTFFLLLLNTSLHNPNVKPMDRMSLDVFLKTCRTIACNYSDDEFENMYRVLQRKPFAVPMRNPGETTKELTFSRQQILCRSSKRIGTRVMTRVRNQATKVPLFFPATSTETVLSMFEISWFHFMAALSSLMDAKDIRLVPNSMNGFKYAISLAIGLGVSTETEALMAQLTRFACKHTNDSTVGKPGDGPDVHLQEELFQKALSLAGQNPKSAIRFVSESIEDMKRDFVCRTNFRKLQELQSSFTTDVNVVHPGRAYLGQGDVHKLTSKSSDRRYRLFLFSDSVLYASASGSKYKVHRVVQLPFCQVEDLEDTKELRNAFRVRNPQKTFVLFTESRESKGEWISELNEAIRQSRQRRNRLLSAARNLQRQGGIDPDIVCRLETTSAFLGKSEAMLETADQSFREFDDRCKLCFRSFSMFNRKHSCGSCLDLVCGNCLTSRNAESDSPKLRACACCNAMLDVGVSDMAVNGPNIPS